MSILVGKCFGLGNAVLTIPLLKAFSWTNGQPADILVGTLPDDAGAFDVFRRFKDEMPGHVGNIYLDKADRKYDFAVMAIPFDGRWKNGEHFRADFVLDGRTRPDPSTVGLSSWKRHEISYMMENCLLWKTTSPSTQFITSKSKPADGKRRVYVGIGYKKDEAGFWLKKHWGNANYTALVGRLLDQTDADIFFTGNELDFIHVVKPILQRYDFDPRIKYEICSFDTSFDVMSMCDVYVGNDTGMMHVAASMEIPCVGLFFLENSIVKNPPWTRCKDIHRCIDGSARVITVQEVYDSVCSIIGK